MCKIILSINPEFVDKIISGEKKYEFRTRIPKRTVDKIVIYSTSPVMKVLAEVDVKKVVSDTPNRLWNTTKENSGIKESFFYKYFNERTVAHAFELGDVKVFENPKNLIDFGCKAAPQSFIYIS